MYTDGGWFMDRSPTKNVVKLQNHWESTRRKKTISDSSRAPKSEQVLGDIRRGPRCSEHGKTRCSFGNNDIHPW
jgi:hypothetical protein